MAMVKFIFPCQNLFATSVVIRIVTFVGDWQRRRAWIHLLVGQIEHDFAERLGAFDQNHSTALGQLRPQIGVLIGLLEDLR